jgi:hypothetical protein
MSILEKSMVIPVHDKNLQKPIKLQWRFFKGQCNVENRKITHPELSPFERGIQGDEKKNP